MELDFHSPIHFHGPELNEGQGNIYFTHFDLPSVVL
jgi:hypothetical protein